MHGESDRLIKNDRAAHSSAVASNNLAIFQLLMLPCDDADDLHEDDGVKILDVDTNTYWCGKWTQLGDVAPGQSVVRRDERLQTHFGLCHVVESELRSASGFHMLLWLKRTALLS